MNIIKHGKYHSDKQQRIIFLGVCKKCGCEFETYIDVVHSTNDATGEKIIFKSDDDLTNVDVIPHTRWGASEWNGTKVIFNTNIVLESFDCYCSCPDCKTDVKLEEQTKISEIKIGRTA